MGEDRTGQIAVLFVSKRTADDDDAGYAEAATAMDVLAAQQPGYRGIESQRGDAGVGITISYWADDASAIAWREHPEHAAIRARGRERWYAWYEVIVTRVERGYRWRRA